MVVAVTGASGLVYGVRALEMLREAGIEIESLPRWGEAIAAESPLQRSWGRSRTGRAGRSRDGGRGARVPGLSARPEIPDRSAPR